MPTQAPTEDSKSELNSSLSASESDVEPQLQWMQKKNWLKRVSPDYSRLLPANVIKRRPLVSSGGKHLSCLLRFMADSQLETKGDESGLNAVLDLIQTPVSDDGFVAFDGMSQVMKWCDELLRVDSGERLMAFGPLLSHQLAWLRPEALTHFFVNCTFKKPLSNATTASPTTNVVNDGSELVKALLLGPSAPRMVQLPDRYEELFAVYGGAGQGDGMAICGQCGQRPRDPALCLLCGAFICLNNVCCVTKLSGIRIHYELSQVSRR